MWDFKSKVLKPKVIRCLHILVIDPLLILLYLSDIPKPFLERVIYISKWVVISTLISILIGLRAIQKSSKRMWLSNRIGGIIFSQLQTEYLIWRINKRTEQATK